MDTQFFIRKSHGGSPANKLQKAILDAMPAYCNQLTDEPKVFTERLLRRTLTNRINYINCQFPRCSPVKVESTQWVSMYSRVGSRERGRAGGFRFRASLN